MFHKIHHIHYSYGYTITKYLSIFPKYWIRRGWDKIKFMGIDIRYWRRRYNFYIVDVIGLMDLSPIRTINPDQYHDCTATGAY